MNRGFSPLTIGIIALAITANADTHYVNLNNPSPTPPYTNWLTAATNIQDAIDAADASDTVLVTNGVYATGGRVVYGAMTNRVVVNKPIWLQSVNGRSTTYIQGNPAVGFNAVRCVYMVAGATIAGFTLSSGATASTGDYTYEQSGGAILGESSNVFVLDCNIEQSTAAVSGGGVCMATLSNCNVTACVAAQGGGVNSGVLWNCSLISNTAGKFSKGNPIGGGAFASILSDCLVTSNRGMRGGAGAAYSSLYNCVVTNNSAAQSPDASGGDGGGGYSCMFSNCVVSKNRAKYWGGGAVFGSLQRCIVTDNLCDVYGGGLYRADALYCSIAGNFCGNGGAGAWRGALTNCILRNNVTHGYGGGCYESTAVNCTIVKNDAARGGGVSLGYIFNSIAYDNTAGIEGSNYWGAVTFIHSCSAPSPLSGAMSITNAPVFVGPTMGNFQLQSNSPCINAGNNAYVSGSTDLDGNPRIAGGTVDIGAYEFQSPSSVLSYAWAQQYGLPTDGSADFADTDNEGMNNWQEWRSGTVPTNAASALRMATVTNAAVGLDVSWESVSSRSYWLERGGDLGAAPAFQTIATNILGVSGVKTFNDLSATNGGPYFYRVGVQ